MQPHLPLMALLIVAASPARALSPSTSLRLEIAPYSQLNELYDVAGRAGRSLLKPRPAGDQAVPAQVAKFWSLHDRHLTRRMAFAGTPKQRNETALDQRRLFWWQAARSATRQQFKDATFPLFPADKHTALFAAFAAAAPRGSPAKHRAAVADYKKALHHELVRSALLIAKMHRFYGSAWPQAKPIYVHLLPKAKPSSTTMATIIADRILLEVPPKPAPEKAQHDIQVVLHEIAHGLYGSQPLSVKHHLDQLFKQDANLASRGAYKLIDEAMATAIGNAWSAKQLLGRLPPEPWYNNRGINALAHAMLPLVERYLDSGRTMDAAFVTESIGLYRRMMGDELFRLDGLLTDVALAVSGELSVAECKSQLHAAFPGIAGFYQSRPLTAPETREVISEAGTQFMPVVLMYKSLEELRSALEDNMPKAILADLLASPAPAWSVVAPGDRVFIGLQVGSEADIAGLLGKIKKTTILPQSLHRYR